MRTNQKACQSFWSVSQPWASRTEFWEQRFVGQFYLQIMPGYRHTPARFVIVSDTRKTHIFRCWSVPTSGHYLQIKLEVCYRLTDWLKQSETANQKACLTWPVGACLARDFRFVGKRIMMEDVACVCIIHKLLGDGKRRWWHISPGGSPARSPGGSPARSPGGSSVRLGPLPGQVPGPTRTPPRAGPWPYPGPFGNLRIRPWGHL